MKEESLNYLFRQAALSKGDRILFADEAEECSGNQALACVQSLSKTLLGMGLKKQDRVAFLCDSSVRHVLGFFACQHLGLIPCALHVRSTLANLAAAMSWLDATALIIDSKYEALANEILDQSEARVPVLFQDREAPAPGDTKLEPAAIDVNAPAMIILSSGTTGEPKGIIHSQKTLFKSAMAAQSVFGEISKDDSVVIAMAPSFAAWNHVCFPFLASEARLVFNHGFEAERYINTINKEKISHAPLVPTAWRRVLATLKPGETLSSLKQVFFSGEPGTRDFISSISEKLPGARIRTAYLSSEGGDATACVADHELLSGETLCVGAPVAGARVRIVDPEGSVNDELASGQTGEIAVQSESVALGYWKNEALTRQRFVEGWWRSGDLGCMDENGRLAIDGRNDNLIISGGLKVHAEEVEAVLLRHPTVSLAAVVGEQDSQWGQRIVGHVVCEDETNAQSIIDWCRESDLLPSFKIPKQIHIRESLPTGATGKIYRKALLEQKKAVQ